MCGLRGLSILKFKRIKLELFNGKNFDLKKKIIAAIVVSVVFSVMSALLNQHDKAVMSTLTRPEPGETDEIKQIVNEITIKSQQVEQTMDESVGIIEEQNVSIKDAKELFNTISDSVNGLKEGLDNITQLNEAMDTNRNNVVSKMEDVAAVATETAAASEEVTASAVDVEQTMHDLNEFTVELDNIAEALKEAIDKFKLQ